MRLLLIVCVGLIIPSPYIASAQETPAEQATKTLLRIPNHHRCAMLMKSSMVKHANAPP
uniref:Secreted protein n=1 Tax=Loa loa TaxID=7209 RepID=A0A1I7VMV5_LOALO